MSLSPSVPLVPPVPTVILTAGILPARVLRAAEEWAEQAGLSIEAVGPSELSRGALRSAVPSLIIIGSDDDEAHARELIRMLKADSRLQTVPAIIAISAEESERWLTAGADEVVVSSQRSCEIKARLAAAVRRSRRDIQVNPSTRLTGADAIATAIADRMGGGELFAACYADLDHFKEFNDRYGYAQGDDVIRSVAELIVDVVDGIAGAGGFVGHIGGDDFLFLVPLELVAETCDTLVRRADETLTMRYSAHDRQAGYFFGKDRRGRLDRVPLMTLSIGVVTNERRRFAHAAQVSELATEMKTYAKTLPGSVWAMDRRSDGESAYPPEEKRQ